MLKAYYELGIEYKKGKMRLLYAGFLWTVIYQLKKLIDKFIKYLVPTVYQVLFYSWIAYSKAETLLCQQRFI